MVRAATMRPLACLLLAFPVASFACGESPPANTGGSTTTTTGSTTTTPAPACDAPLDRSHDGPFAPADQTPFMDRGLVLAEDALPCIPASTGVSQTNCYHHGSTVAELPDGSVGVAWYHGEAEKSLDSRLVWAKAPPGSTTFAAPEVLYDEPSRAEGNPALWVSKTGEILVFFATIYGDGWAGAKVRLTRSTDGGKTFATPVTVVDKYCGMPRHRPLQLASGDMVLPLYHECFALPMFASSSDQFQTFTVDLPLPFLDHSGQIQPALIQGDGGALLAITRDGSGKDRIHRMESADGGHAWTKSAPLLLPNPGSSVDWVRLANGHVVVVFNNSPDRRNPLTVALSVDQGQTFTALRDLDTTCPTCDWSYPSIMQSQKDGSLWVSYTHDRKTIGWAHFNESWLAAGTEKAVLHCLLGESCRGGACLTDCATNDDCAVAGETCVEGACAKACAGATDCCGGRCVEGRCLMAPEVVCQ